MVSLPNGLILKKHQNVDLGFLEAIYSSNPIFLKFLVGMTWQFSSYL